MSYYLVASIDIHDFETYKIYAEKATAAFQPFVGKQTIVSQLFESPIVFEREAPSYFLVTKSSSLDDIKKFYN